MVQASPFRLVDRSFEQELFNLELRRDQRLPADAVPSVGSPSGFSDSLAIVSMWMVHKIPQAVDANEQDSATGSRLF